MSERKSNALSNVIMLEENMNVYIHGPVTRRVFNKSAITSRWVDLTFHHHLDLNQSLQGPRTIGEKKKKTEIRFCPIIYLFQMHNWEAYIIFLELLSFLQWHMHFFSRSLLQGAKGACWYFGWEFFEVRGEERERWRARMKGGDDERTKMQQWKRNLQKYKIAGASAGLKYLFFWELTI